MDIRQLRYFLGVLEAKSFTKAAEFLHVAQPAIGMQIRKLEEELGVKLLVRHSRGVAPTEAGAELKNQAKELLQHLEQVRQKVVDIGGEPRGQIVLGMTTATMHVLAGKVAAACRSKYPNVELNMTEEMSRRLTERVSRGRVDIAFTYYIAEEFNGISEALAEESLFFISPAKHPAAKASEIALNEVLTYDLVFSSRWPSLFRASLEDAAKADGKSLRIAYEADSVAMIKEIVCHGLAHSVLPSGAVDKEVKAGDLVAIPIVEPRMTRTLYLAHSKKRLSSKALEVVQEEIRAIVSELVASRSFGWAPPGTADDPYTQTESSPLEAIRL